MLVRYVTSSIHGYSRSHFIFFQVAVRLAQGYQAASFILDFMLMFYNVFDICFPDFFSINSVVSTGDMTSVIVNEPSTDDNQKASKKKRKVKSKGMMM